MVPSGQQRNVCLLAFRKYLGGTFREKETVNVRPEPERVLVLHRGVQKLLRRHGAQFLKRICSVRFGPLGGILLALRQRLRHQSSSKKRSALSNRAVNQSPRARRSHERAHGKRSC